MRDFNKVIQTGRLVADPEIRYIASGNAVTKMRIAVNDTTKKEDASFFDVVAWDSQHSKLAENCNSYLHKGSQVLVEGRLKSRSYTTKNGDKRSVVEIVADRVQFMGGGKKPDGSAAPEAAPAVDTFDPLDVEVPF